MSTSTSSRAVARRLSALCLAGATAFAVAACSPDGGNAQEGEPASTAHPQPAELTQETFADAISAGRTEMTSAHMEMTFSGEAFEATGMTGSPIVADLNLAAEDPEMHVTMTMQGMDIDMVLVGGNAYIGLGELTQGKYLHLNEAELAADPDFAGIAESVGPDLGVQAKSFAEGITSFEKTGTATVDGAEVTLYTMTVDPAKISADAKDAVNIDPEMLAQVDEMTVVYGLDENNIPRTVDITMDVAGQEMTMSTVVSKINEPVTITAPAAELTIPYSEMAN